MELYKTAKWYNPFSINVNNKSYELCDIVFFDKDGVICRTDRGWFTSGISTNNDFDRLEIPGDVKKKIKVFKLSIVLYSKPKSNKSKLYENRLKFIKNFY